MTWNVIYLLSLLLIIVTGSAREINLAPGASWNPTAITIAGLANGTKGSSSSQLYLARGMSITNNDVLYIADTNNNRIVVIDLNSASNNFIISTDRSFGSGLNQFNAPHDVIIVNMSLYVLERDNHRVKKLSLNGSDPTIARSFDKLLTPVYFYVDGDTNIYIADDDKHRVLFYHASGGNFVVVAGNGKSGSDNNQLNTPYGIFVNRVGDIYIADHNNHRIMKWTKNASSGIRVAGNGKKGSSVTQLNQPIYVTVDTNEYMYISEVGNNRITRWAPYATSGECIAGCTGTSGKLAYHLSTPASLAFDSSGSLYVSDQNNHRIQKFSILAASKCFAPVIEIVPSVVSLSKAIQHGQNENLNITSKIQLSCSSSSTTNIQWTIFSCLSTCSKQIEVNQSIQISQTYLFIPAQSFSSGFYQILLTVAMTVDPTLSASAITYIEIIRSTIFTKLNPSTALTITHNVDDDLTVNPGEYSFDLYRVLWNKEEWIYLYYCRMDLTNDQKWELFDDVDQTCFRNLPSNQQSWKSDDSINSSLTILGKSFEANRTYQLMVKMINEKDSSWRSVGYLTVEVKVFYSPVIQISCTIVIICTPKGKFYHVNPTNELSLYSTCTGDCSSVDDIQWNIYQGVMISPNSGNIQWTSSPSTSSSLLYGVKTNTLTIEKQFFLQNPTIIYWRLEVIYSFGLNTSEKTFDIQMNDKPTNGNCSIDPHNGTIMTVFTVNCSNWHDPDGIKDYTVFGHNNKSSTETMLIQSSQSIIQLRLPVNTNFVVYIRDTVDAISENHLPAVLIIPDETIITNLIDQLQMKSENLSSHPIIELLTNADSNTAGQMSMSISEILNDKNEQSIEFLVQNGISLSMMTITSLNNEIYPREINVSDEIYAKEYHKRLNRYAHLREYLVTAISNLSIHSPTDVIFQSTILATLTQSTNQLTRKSSSVASKKCEDLSNALKLIARRTSAEDVNITAAFLLQCVVNALNGVNGVLQERANVLDLDIDRAKHFRISTDIDQINQQNIYLQRQSVHEIIQRMDRIIATITSSLNIHLNLHQQTCIKTNSYEFVLSKLPREYFFNSTDINEPILVRKLLKTLALGDLNDQTRSYTNFSRSFSYSVLDQRGNEIKIQTNSNHLTKFFIPRDPNLIIPPMFPQNVTSLKNEEKELFHYHPINLTQNNSNLTFSLHLELQPLNINLSYVLIYQFDDIPKLNSLYNWTYLCPEDLNEDQFWIHFVDNHQTSDHHSIVYGMRELDSKQDRKFCSNKTLHPNLFVKIDQPFHFTSDYRLRIYQSGCFYLDSNHRWQSDGLLVGSMTNHNQTQCFSLFTSAL